LKLTTLREQTLQTYNSDDLGPT